MKSLVLLLALSGNAFASCEKGCYEWKGSCACDAATEKVEAVKASDEKPRHGLTPEWQTGDLQIDKSVPAVDDYKSSPKMDDQAYFTPNGVTAHN